MGLSNFLYPFLFLVLCSVCSTRVIQNDWGGTTKIFSIEQKHLALTDLGVFKKKFYYTFRVANKHVGDDGIIYLLSSRNAKNWRFARSHFVVKDAKEGAVLSIENVWSIRPGLGLHTKYFKDILGKRFPREVKRGEPFVKDMVGLG